jgi:dynactin complex subunit
VFQHWAEGNGLRRIGIKLREGVTNKLEAVLESDEQGDGDEISYVDLKSLVEKRVLQTFKEVSKEQEEPTTSCRNNSLRKPSDTELF